MNTNELQHQLDTLVSHDIRDPAMIWGPPGIGKTTIVRNVATAHQLEMVDLRIAQVPPADLRGLPIVDPKAAEPITRYARPEWLRPDGSGILFLDELRGAIYADGTWIVINGTVDGGLNVYGSSSVTMNNWRPKRG